LTFCLAVDAGAQSTNFSVARRTLSLRECIAMSLENNLDLKIERYNPKIADYLLRASYGAYDPVVSVFAKHSYLDQPARVNPDNLRKQSFIDPVTSQPYTVTFVDTQNPFDQVVNGVGGGLTGRLPTGTQYELGVRTDYQDVTAFPLPGEILTSGQTNYNYATASFTVRQPLLRNLWIDAERMNIQLAKKDVQISELALRARMMTNVTDVMMAYYDLISAREIVRVNQKELELTRQLFTETRRRMEVGDRAQLDVKLTESQVETVQANITAAEQIRHEKQNVLKELLAKDMQHWNNFDIDPAETLVASKESYDRQQCWQNALLYRPDLEELRLELEKRKILVRYANNQLYPNLDIIGGVGVQAYGTGAGETWRGVRDADHTFYNIGIMLSMPLSRTAERNQYKASLAAQEQSELRIQKKQLRVVTSIDTAVRGVESAKQRVESNRKARSYADDALAAEQKKFQNGLSTSFMVLEYQRNLTAARTAEIQAMADYYKTRALLHLEEGTTLSLNQIEVKVR
jgi:outer membrane protein TolC